jgi:hypothetical protein
MAIPLPTFRQGNLDPVTAVGVDSAYIGRPILVFAVVYDRFSVSFPHLVAGPVFLTPSLSFVSHAVMSLAVPEPNPAYAAIRWPFIVIKNKLRIHRGKLHMRDPGFRNTFTQDFFSTFGIENPKPGR